MRAPIAAVAVVLLTAVVASRAPAPTALVIQAGPDLGGDALDGLHFGIAEANRTAGLLGKAVRLASGPATAPMIAASARIVRRAPLVVLQPDEALDQSAAPCVFALSPLPGAIDARLKEWLSRHRSAPAASASLAAWHPALTKFGASELNDRYHAATGRGMTAPAWLAWAAVKALSEAWLAADGPLTCSTIAAHEFDGHKGAALRFDQVTRILQQPWYVVSGNSVIGEVR